MNAESTAKGSVGWVGFNTYTLEIRRTLIRTNLPPPPQKDDNYENDNFAAYFASAASNRLISLIIYIN